MMIKYGFLALGLLCTAFGSLTDSANIKLSSNGSLNDYDSKIPSMQQSSVLQINSSSNAVQQTLKKSVSNNLLKASAIIVGSMLIFGSGALLYHFASKTSVKNKFNLNVDFLNKNLKSAVKQKEVKFETTDPAERCFSENIDTNNQVTIDANHTVPTEANQIVQIDANQKVPTEANQTVQPDFCCIDSQSNDGCVKNNSNLTLCNNCGIAIESMVETKSQPSMFVGESKKDFKSLMNGFIDRCLNNLDCYTHKQLEILYLITAVLGIVTSTLLMYVLHNYEKQKKCNGELVRNFYKYKDNLLI